MPNKKKAVIIGNYKVIKPHPFENVDLELTRIFEKDMDVICTDDHNTFCFDNISQYDLCISYVDSWKKKMSQEQAAGIVSYVSSGGGLLALHTGISYQTSPEYAKLIGARFVKHPPFQELNFQVIMPDHPIMQGASDFTIKEEPYIFEFDPFTEKTIILEYEFEGVMKPAGWVHEFGLGRVAYLMPGHRVDAFMNPVYREMVLKGGKWAAKLI